MKIWDRLLGRKSIEIQTSTARDVIAGFPTWLPYDSYGAMYRKQPAVRTVVDFLAKNAAQLNPKIYQRIDDDDRREWHDHPVAELLRSPNPATTRYSHLRGTVADIAIYDRAYWRMMRSRGLVRALVRIPPSKLEIQHDPKTDRTTYRLNGEEIPKTELVIFPGYHPDGGETGVSPLETLRRVLAEDWAATTHREFYWRNASRQGGVIERPDTAPEWSVEARDLFLQDWRDQTIGGLNSGTTPLLEDGMKWRPGGFSPMDSQYLEGHKLTLIEVAMVYAPALAKLLGEGSVGGDAESFHRQLYQDVLAPLCRSIQDEIDRQLLGLPEFDLGEAYTEFNLAEKLKGSFEEQGRTLVTAVGVPYMSINEGRARLNMPKLDNPDFDTPIQPLNVLYGGQPSVVVPTEDPGTASREMARKLLGFLERMEASIISHLGGLKDQGELTVMASWADDRWVRELSEITDDAEALNDKWKTAVVSAFASGGVKAAREAFATAKLDLFDEVRI